MLFKKRKYKKLKEKFDNHLSEVHSELKSSFFKEFEKFNSEISGLPKGNDWEGFSDIRRKYNSNTSEYVGKFGAHSDENFEKLRIFFRNTYQLKRHLHFLSTKDYAKRKSQSR